MTSEHSTARTRIPLLIFAMNGIITCAFSDSISIFSGAQSIRVTFPCAISSFRSLLHWSNAYWKFPELQKSTRTWSKPTGSLEGLFPIFCKLFPSHAGFLFIPFLEFRTPRPNLRLDVQKRRRSRPHPKGSEKKNGTTRKCRTVRFHFPLAPS